MLIKKVYLTPFNNISIEFSKSQFFKQKYELLGFIDNKKKGKDVFSIEEKVIDSFDLVIICSPNYSQEIYYHFIKSGIKSNKIKFYLNNLNRIVSVQKFADFFYYGTIRDYLYIRKLKNKYKDKRIFLLGNGPSLKIEDLELLKDEITFASNKIFLAYEHTKWRPTYYLVEDDLVYKQNYKKIKGISDSIKIFPQYSLAWENPIDDAYYFNMKYCPDRDDFPQFNPNPIEGMFWGSTVIFTMIQWAIYFGCKEIYLLGVDFDFTESKKYVINEDNRKDLICEGEVNHFHKDYRKIGEKWNLPNLDVQYKSFLKAKEYAEINNINIFNISRNSKLDIFEKIEFDKIL
ncbi:MAG: 6-hydroxymethylpterin diphosphokinase MptE-like protein [Arcobacter sp.]|uniref:6-hydroxymethylpterin diphosphokinase MptE-like protein n=1 Tax=Arcobacter sp. TaxID=1872629 RepID=UPI003C76C37C